MTALGHIDSLGDPGGGKGFPPVADRRAQALKVSHQGLAVRIERRGLLGPVFFKQPGEPGHDRIGDHLSRTPVMGGMPSVAVAAADPRQIRPDPAGAEQMRMIPRVFPGLGDRSPAEGLSRHRPDVLGVAIPAPFADIHLPSLLFQGRIGRHVHLHPGHHILDLGHLLLGGEQGRDALRAHGQGKENDPRHHHDGGGRFQPVGTRQGRHGDFGGGPGFLLRGKRLPVPRALVEIDEHQNQGHVHGHAAQRPGHPPRLHFLHRVHKVGAVLQHGPLHEPLGREAHRHDGEAADGEPEVPTGQAGAPELPAGEPRPDIVQAPHGPDDHGTENGQMRMGDDEIVEMRQFLHPAQGFDGSLETTQEIIQRAQDQEFPRIGVGVGAAQHRPPAPPHGPEEIDGDRPDGDDQQHAGDDGDRLGPVGNGAEQVMMGPHEGIKERQGPKPEKRQFMTEQRLLGAQRQEIINDRQPRRGEPQPHDVMDEQAVHRRTVDAGDIAVSQDHVAENQVEQGPDKSRGNVPERNVKPALGPLEDGPQHLDRDAAQNQEAEEIERPLEFGRLQSQVVAQHQGGASQDQEGVPQPQKAEAPFLLVESRPAKPRHGVIQ